MSVRVQVSLSAQQSHRESRWFFCLPLISQTSPHIVTFTPIRDTEIRDTVFNLDFQRNLNPIGALLGVVQR